VVTRVPAGGLTAVEHSLVEHVRDGEWLDLIPEVPKDEVVDEAAMRSWRKSRTCRASVIREILSGRHADPDPHGLRLRGAKITGRLDLENLSTKVNLELTDCLLEDGVIAQEARMTSVSLRRCRLEHAAKPPLDAAGLACSLLDLSGATIIGHAASERGGAAGDRGGAVCLRGAHIEGHLDCTGATLRNDNGPALLAGGVRVGLGMFLRYGFAATGVGEGGAVVLGGASVGIHLVCSGASLRNDSGPALFAKGLHVEHDMHLDEGFTAIGVGAKGAVHLSGAHIGGSFECDGALLCNKSGPALYANRLQVGQVVNLRYGFTAASGDRDPKGGAVHLTGARIGGSLHCDEAALRNESGSALVADSLETGRGIYLYEGFTATSGGEGVAVNLVRAQVGGALIFNPTRLEHATYPCHRLAVDGLTYAGVPVPSPDKQRDADKQPDSAQRWRKLLREGTPAYAAQPYQHLAAGYRALGEDRQARETLIAQRKDQLARTGPGRRERLWGFITRFTLGYGYKPWRALGWVAGVLAVSCVLAIVLGAHGALAQTDKTTARTRTDLCTVIQQVSVGLDLNLPVGASVARAQCDLNPHSGSVTAFWLTAAGWVLRVLGWAFAALFIAGFTSAVRKT
jgi:hypothetical protein